MTSANCDFQSQTAGTITASTSGNNEVPSLPRNAQEEVTTGQQSRGRP